MDSFHQLNRLPHQQQERSSPRKHSLGTTTSGDTSLLPASKKQQAMKPQPIKQELQQQPRRPSHRVRFDEHRALEATVIPIESKCSWSEEEKKELWVQKLELVKSMQDLSLVLETCMSKASETDKQAYIQCLTETYVACCMFPNDLDDNDEAFVVHQISRSQTQTLAHGRAVTSSSSLSSPATGVATTSGTTETTTTSTTQASPLHHLRGLEARVVPEVANEQRQRRVEHVRSTVQLHQQLCGMPQSDLITSAVAQRLSRPSRRFAAVMGSADELAAQALLEQEQQPPPPEAPSPPAVIAVTRQSSSSSLSSSSSSKSPDVKVARINDDAAAVEALENDTTAWSVHSPTKPKASMAA